MNSLYKIIAGCMVIIISALCLTGCKSDSEEKIILYQMDDSIETTRIQINIDGYEPVSFRLYRDDEAEAVDKFISLCSEGFYNGTDFFNIIDGYLIMGGDPSSSVTVNKSDTETRLHPLFGSLCVNITDGTVCELGSFYIIGSTQDNLNNINELLEFKDYEFKDYLKFGYDTELTDDELAIYNQYGGAPWLYGHTAVLGQAYEGLDVISRIFEDHKEDSSRQFIITSIETY